MTDAEIRKLQAQYPTENDPMPFARAIIQNYLEKDISKKQLLEIIKLLSAMESWSFASKDRIPDYLYDKIADCMNVLTEEVLR